MADDAATGVFRRGRRGGARLPHRDVARPARRRDPRAGGRRAGRQPDEPERGREDAAALLEVADRAGGEPVEQVHVGTEQGEVFALRHAGLAAVAVTERFALASLIFFDMRAMLRDLAAAARAAERVMPPKPHRVLLDRVSGYADEAAAYMRRRRVSRRPFARLYYPGGRAEDHAADSDAGGELSSPPGG